MNLLKILIFLITATTLVSCGSMGVKDREALRLQFSKGKIGDAINALEKSEIKKDKDSQILYMAERGRLEFARGDYTLAADYFSKALELVDKYYTKSLTKKALSKLLNENFDKYYGENFEISLLHYYLAQSYYHIYITGNKTEFDPKTKKRITKKLSRQKKRAFLFSARAQILEWDSFFKALQRGGLDTLYVSDLLVKLFGAKIHEVLGDRSELQIALQLYKDAKKVLYTVGGVYQSYNQQFKEYVKVRMDKPNKIVNSKPKKNFKDSDVGKQLTNYIDMKILQLTKELRPREIKKIIKQQNIDKKVVKKFNSQKKKPNVSIMVESGMISPKKAKTINLGLGYALKNMEDGPTKALLIGIGVPVISYFAMNTLGLVPKNRAMTYGEFVYARNVSRFAVTGLSIEFELPMVEKSKPEKPMKLLIFKKGETKVYKTKEIPVVAPLGDIARHNLEESAANRLTTKGIRVAIKHIAAIIAAYQVYKSMSDNGKGLFAGTVATGQYFLSAKGIAASEKADTRYWSTLPQAIRMVDLYLPEGEYVVKLDQKSKTTNAPHILGQLNVKNTKKMDIFSFSKPSMF